MGRKIMCHECNTVFDEDILKSKNSENTCLVCGANVGGDENEVKDKLDEHSDWITWWYYGFKKNNGKTTILDDEPIDLDKHGDKVFLIKEFKAAPRDANGSDKAKEILRTYIPDAYAPAAGYATVGRESFKNN